MDPQVGVEVENEETFSLFELDRGVGLDRYERCDRGTGREQEGKYHDHDSPSAWENSRSIELHRLPRRD